MVLDMLACMSLLMGSCSCILISFKCITHIMATLIRRTGVWLKPVTLRLYKWSSCFYKRIVWWCVECYLRCSIARYVLANVDRNDKDWYEMIVLFVLDCEWRVWYDTCWRLCLCLVFFGVCFVTLFV